MQQVTSVLSYAALQPHLGRLNKMAYDAILATGDIGLTQPELRDMFPDVPPATIQPRVAQLAKKGLVYNSGEFRVSRHDRKSIVWKVTANSSPKDPAPTAEAPTPAPSTTTDTPTAFHVEYTPTPKVQTRPNPAVLGKPLEPYLYSH